MPEKILGLDLGGNSLKAVLLTRKFRGGYRIIAVRLIDITAAGGLSAALGQLFADQRFCGTVCITALDAGMLSFRSIQLPFRHDRKIRQTLAFALEPLIQIPLDDVFIDYKKVGGEGKSEIFAAIAPRALVEDRTTLLNEYVKETTAIDVSAVPLAIHLARYSSIQEALLLLDIGARDTTAIFVCNTGILHIRHFPFGGETAATREEGTTPVNMGEACNRFCIELKNTWISLLWQGAVSQIPMRVLLTGGGSRIAGLDERLMETFLAPVERVDLLAAGDIQIDESLRSLWDPAIMDQALALAIRPMGKESGFNFRQRAYEGRVEYSELQARLKKSAIAIVVILILAGVEIGLDGYADRLRLTSLKNEVHSEFKSYDPDVTRIIDPVAQLKGKIAEARKLSAGVGEAVTEATVLDLLKETSALAPSDLLLTSFNLDGDAISLKGDAQNFDAIEMFKKGFVNSKYFKMVVVGSTSMVKQGSRVEFDLKVILKK
jgi:general secretion pathway protein L